jgi:uncharacterized protein
MLRQFVCFGLMTLTAAGFVQADPVASPIKWQPWSDEVFAQAKRENKFVLLDLEAVWCHWCHVMAETTYRDPAVTAQLNERYLTVRVDH